jgi:hypothetical protein
MASVEDVRALFGNESDALRMEAIAEMDAHAAEGRLGELPGLKQEIKEPPSPDADREAGG